MKRKNGRKLSKEDIALSNLIRAIKMPLTSSDLLLLEAVKKLAKEKCERGVHHTCSLILGKSGKYHVGLQQTYHRAGDIETCAEEVAKGNIQYEKDIAVTVVTAHFLPIADRADGGVVTIVPPCSGCTTRLRHLALTQNAPVGVIVIHNDKAIKIPPKYCALFTYPIAYNNDGTSRI